MGGPPLGQKSLDPRSRDFCPHREPRGELIAQYRPPMPFCFYPTLYLRNHLYFFEAWQFSKRAKEYIYLGERKRRSTKLVVMVTQPRLFVYIFIYGDATTFICDVSMVSVATHAPNNTNMLCWKIAPKPLVYIDPRILLNYYTFIPGGTI